MAALDHTHCRTHPCADLLLDIRIFPIAGDDLALHAKTAEDMTIFTITVRGLVLIHKVHVDGVIWDLPVELGM